MEALGSLGIDFKILLAQIINFLLLLLILKKFLYGPIIQNLDKRKKIITEGLENAENAKKAIEQAQLDYQEKINKAVKEADKVLTDAKKQAQKEADDILSQANQNSSNMLERAKIQITQEKDRIVADARKDLSELVILATEKVVESSPSKVNVEKVVEKIK